jgi:hypothetical protein
VRFCLVSRSRKSERGDYDGDGFGGGGAFGGGGGDVKKERGDYDGGGFVGGGAFGGGAGLVKKERGDYDGGGFGGGGAFGGGGYDEEEEATQRAVAESLAEMEAHEAVAESGWPAADAAEMRVEMQAEMKKAALET